METILYKIHNIYETNDFNKKWVNYQTSGSNELVSFRVNDDSQDHSETCFPANKITPFQQCVQCIRNHLKYSP